MDKYCPICDNTLTMDEPEEGIVRVRCTRCPYESEREVDHDFWI